MFPKARIYGGGRRPAPRRQAPLPPFDPDDRFGIVHTALPPEQVIPDHFVDPVFLRASFATTTIPGNYEPKGEDNIKAAGGVRITDGRFAGLRIPFLEGANTTPATMLMTPMLAMYPRDIIEAFLTLQAEAGLDDIVISSGGWNMPENGFAFTGASYVEWCSFLHNEWGFRVVHWNGDPWDIVNPMFLRAFVAGLLSFVIHGKEVNSSSSPHMDAPTYNESLHQLNDFIQGRIPIGAHFSGDEGRCMGYPQSAPAYIQDWSQFNGRVHLCQQLIGLSRDPERTQPNKEHPDDPDRLVYAGLQGSATYYARLRLMGMGDGSIGPGAPDSRVIAFESMETAALYGKCSEDYAALRNWELLCGTRNDARIPPVSGFGGGNRYPNGDPI